MCTSFLLFISSLHPADSFFCLFFSSSYLNRALVHCVCDRIIRCKQVCLGSTQVSICFPFALPSLGRNPPLPPPTSPKKSPVCAAQEELVLAALRIEALQVAKNISQCPSLSTVNPQVLRWILHQVYGSVCEECRQKKQQKKLSECTASVWCACMSVFQPAPKHTVVSLTANSWPYQHGGCTTTSSVPPPLQPSPTPPHTKKPLTWLNVSSSRPLPGSELFQIVSSGTLRPLSPLPLLCMLGNMHVACSWEALRTWAWMWLGVSRSGISTSSS